MVGNSICSVTAIPVNAGPKYSPFFVKKISFVARAQPQPKISFTWPKDGP